MGNGKIPDEYSECYICDALNITLTELREQDYEWVVKMMTYLGIKEKVIEHRQKSANTQR